MPAPRLFSLMQLSYVPVVVVLVGLILLHAMAVDLSREKLRGDLRVQTADRLGLVRARLEGGISGPAQVTRGLAAAFATEPHMAPQRFEAFAHELLKDQPQVRNVAAAPDLVIRYVYPRPGNDSILGVDYRAVPQQWAASRRAIQSGRLTLAGPVPLIQGGQGIIARLVVYTPGEDGLPVFWGMVSAVLEIEALMTSSGLSDADLPIEVAVRGTDGQGANGPVFFGREGLFAEAPVLTDVAVPGGAWQLAGVPRGGWEAGLPSLLPLHLAFLIGGCLIVVPLAMTARLVEERRRNLVRLARSEERYRRLFEDSDDPATLLVGDRVVLANDAARRILGFARLEDLYGIRPVDLAPPVQPDGRTSAEMAAAVLAEAESQGSCRFEWIIRRPDGSSFPVEVNLTKIPYQDSGTAILSVMRDISERRATEEQVVRTLAALERSNAELQQFAYVASHDLQEPLRVVTSFLQLLERRLGDTLDPDIRDYINFAVDGARRMRQLILDLLAYSRVSLEEDELEPVDLRRVMAEVLDSLRPAMEEAEAAITIDPLPVVPGSALHLTSLLQNLLSNAIKYREPTRPLRIAVTCENRAEDWLIRVSDTGIGIAPEYRERIFVIFQRLHARAQGGGPRSEGTGIGLALCRRIVERHHGQLGVDSLPGEGSTFWFTLPKTPTESWLAGAPRSIGAPAPCGPPAGESGAGSMSKEP